eukprot:XP_028336259.1 uncharacterized protein LOC112067609 isoform X1 [Physeter catodon]
MLRLALAGARAIVDMSYSRHFLDFQGSAIPRAMQKLVVTRLSPNFREAVTLRRDCPVPLPGDGDLLVRNRVEREQPGHKLRRLGNVLWRKEAGDPLAFPVRPRLAAASQWRSLSLGVSVCASPVPSACCQCCVTVVCALQRTDGRVARVPGGWAGAGVGAWLHWAARFADLRVTLARVVARPSDRLFHLHTSHLRVFPPH